MGIEHTTIKRKKAVCRGGTRRPYIVAKAWASVPWHVVDEDLFYHTECRFYAEVLDDPNRPNREKVFTLMDRLLAVVKGIAPQLVQSFWDDVSDIGGNGSDLELLVGEWYDSRSQEV